MGAAPSDAGWMKLREECLRLRESGGLGGPDGAAPGHRRGRWSRAQEFNEWLRQDNLPNLSQEQALTLYRAGGGAKASEFKSNPIEEVRDALDFLLYDEVKLEGRFDECAAEGGGFKLEGAGKEFVSYVLCLREPSLFAVWNSNAESALRRVGALNRRMRTGPLGIRYLDVLEALAVVRRRLDLPDFRDLDELCYAAARRGSNTGPVKAG